MSGYSFLDVLSRDAFNEGSKLLLAIENHKKRTGYYPKEVLADKIYCNRENRRKLKEMGIRLLAKPLGRPSAVNTEHLRHGERNPIKGKFGQGKSAYGLGRIKARVSRNFRKLDCIHNTGTKPGQTGRGSILVPMRNLLRKLFNVYQMEKKNALLFNQALFI